jgi:hypothetical protein
MAVREKRFGKKDAKKGEVSPGELTSPDPAADHILLF